MTQQLIGTAQSAPNGNGNGHAAAGLAAWDQRWRDEYSRHRTHHMFLFWGATGDYVYGDMDLRTHLFRTLARKQITVLYNRAEGLRCADEEQEQRLMELLGLMPSGEDLAAAAELPGLAPEGGVKLESLPRDPASMLPLIDRLLRQRAVTVAVVLDYVESLAPAGDMATKNAEDRTHLIMLQRWAQDPEVAANGHPIFLVTGSSAQEVNLSLRAASSRVSVIEIPMPGYDERLAFIASLARANEARPDGQRFVMEIDPAEFARVTAGLSKVNIGEIAKHAIGSGQPLDRSLVLAQKKQIIKTEFEDVIELMEPTGGFETLGGMQHVKDYLQYAVIEPMRAGEYEDCPMGVLFLGPAGTGKTAMAKAAAHEANVNAVSLNLARIYQGLVGASERNLERAFRCIESMAPTILFIDELDQKGQRGGGEQDGGTSTRIFGRLLEWLAMPEHRGRIVTLAASNRPDRIDPAMKRPGRLDKKIPFLAPEKADRAQIAAVKLQQYLPGNPVITSAHPAAVKVADRSEGWTGAEIEQLAQKVRELIKQKRAPNVEAAVDMALGLLMPSTAAIQEMTLLALRELNDLDLLPQRLHALALKLRQEQQAAPQAAPSASPVVPAGDSREL